MPIEIKTSILLTCDKCGRCVTVEERGTKAVEKSITKFIKMGWIRTCKQGQVDSQFFCPDCVAKVDLP